ncbi:FxLD family lanthipeptide [Spirillospora albida]|uniref:FxLD family lanthipeptide n=1 Tax=Spirillospora albida TaxID=58123 RepID=UPI0009FCB7F9|nr:FxLD family lanthipeptide [Spirillospora albida]
MGDDEYTLDVRLVDSGDTGSGHATSTDDNCGSGNTGSNACTTNADIGGVR